MSRHLAPRVIVTGVHSGTNPSPGLGVARTIKSTWPDMPIDAIDYSMMATGLQSNLFDKLYVMPHWKDVNLRDVSTRIRDIVNKSNAVLIPGLDLEADILARFIPADPLILTPPVMAIEAARKPSIDLASSLNLKVPRSIITDDCKVLSEFANEVGWPICIKGRRYESVVVRANTELHDAVCQIQTTWSDVKVVAEEYIEGHEEAIAFCALTGNLLEACSMIKTQLTSEGKTWAGAVTDLDEKTKRSLANTLAALGWTGGGEIEIIRSRADDCRYVVDVNPRFPAWIHGATLGGFNLPGLLVAAATKLDLPTTTCTSREFVRIVEEIPVQKVRRKPGVSSDKCTPNGKAHPSGMVTLARRIACDTTTHHNNFPSIVCTDDLRVNALNDAVVQHAYDTPTTVIFAAALEDRLRRTRSLLRTIEGKTGINIVLAYSVKTNPSSLVLAEVLNQRVLGECISLDEVRTCIQRGFRIDDIILNGPAKWWPECALNKDAKFHAINCDSLYDVDSTLKKLANSSVAARRLGLRLRPLAVSSRFGLNVGDPGVFLRAAQSLQRLAVYGNVGIHYHLAITSLGLHKWIDQVVELASFAASLEAASGQKIEYVDLGGGYPPEISESKMEHLLNEAIGILRSACPGIETIIIEPGKLLVQAAMATLCRVMGVTSDKQRRCAVVDSSIADVADIYSHVHDVWYKKDSPTSSWLRLCTGDDIILGRLCMENDIIRAKVSLPEGMNEGDYIAVMDTGGYDYSMRYSFGRGSG